MNHVQRKCVHEGAHQAAIVFWRLENGIYKDSTPWSLKFFSVLRFKCRIQFPVSFLLLWLHAQPSCTSPVLPRPISSLPALLFSHLCSVSNCSSVLPLFSCYLFNSLFSYIIQCSDFSCLEYFVFPYLDSCFPSYLISYNRSVTCPGS